MTLDTASEMAAVSADMDAEQAGESLSPSAPVTPEPSPVSDSKPASPPSQGADETVKPVVTGSDSQRPSEGQKPRGPIPYDRHEAVLKKTREDYDSQLKELEWAKGQSREQVAQMRQLYEWADRDPVGFHKFFGQQLQNDPQYADALKPPPEPVADERPEPDVLLEDGRMVYSGEAMELLMDWRERQLDKRYSEQYGPIRESFQHQQIMSQAHQEASGILTDARTWPGFKEHETAIRDVMAADGRVTLDSAYRRVVVPSLQKQDAESRAKLRQELLAELRGKPSASTTNPSAGSVDPPKSYQGMSTEDIMRSVHAELASP